MCDPPLTELEEQGKAVFARACGQCHGGAGQSTSQASVVRYHTIVTQCPRLVDPVSPPRFAFAPCSPGLARNARIYEITLPNWSRIRRTSSDPGRALITGFVGGPPELDDWNKLDVPGLRGITRTAPYFHNNSAATLEEVVDHYIQFFKAARALAPPGVDRLWLRPMASLRLATAAGRTDGAAGVPPQAIESASGCEVATGVQPHAVAASADGAVP